MSAESTTLISSNSDIINIFNRKNSIAARQAEKKPCSEISFKEFLNFLRTAYQINESIEGNSNEVEIDWQDVATNQLVASLMGLNDDEIRKATQKNKENTEIFTSEKSADIKNSEILHFPIEKSASTHFENLNISRKNSSSEIVTNKRLLNGCKSMEHLMKRKLNEVIQEGLLDSVLPYVVPKLGASHQQLNKKAQKLEAKKSTEKTTHQQHTHKEKQTALRRKSSSGENEVEIHVCDEVKNLKRDFKCPQKLLVSKMGYFAEVTTGQKLEDMDISVHCDITIFDWLMRWVKKDTNIDQAPKLDVGNVVPILVSAAFLQMDPLLEDCLKFCCKNMTEIVKASPNLSCLNDSILTRLANLFSNTEVEALRDRKDKIQSRLYCKLIAALADPTPDPARGHFASLAGLYRCVSCGKLVLRQLAGRVPCRPPSMHIDTLGNVTSTHVRDSNWNLNDYVRQLRQELQSWRAVYWRLWADCHFLQCAVCTSHFPAHQARWCCHHPDQPQFFSMEQQRTTTFPIGRYPCCGERAYRFEVLSNESGCQFKDHVPDLKTERDVAVHKIFSTHLKLITLEPPQLMFPERLTRLVGSKDCLDAGRTNGHETHWWEGLKLVPTHTKQGLLSKIWDPLKHVKKEAAGTAFGGYAETSILETVKKGKQPLRRWNSWFERQSSTESLIDEMFQYLVNQSHCTTADVGTRGPFRHHTSFTAEEERHQLSGVDDSDSEGGDSGDSDASEESGGHDLPTVRVSTRPRHNKAAQLAYAASGGRPGPAQWLPVLSTRNNQDNQREYEERAMKQISAILARKTCGEVSAAIFGRGTAGTHRHHRWGPHVIPPGGTYVRLEHQWKEAHSNATGPRSRTGAACAAGNGSAVGSAASARARLRGRR